MKDQVAEYFLNIPSDYFNSGRTIVDCGHTSIISDGSRFLFGGDGIAPSNTECLTLRSGLRVIRYLDSLNVPNNVSICFTDTSRFMTLESRVRLREVIASGDMYNHLPKEYLRVFDDEGIDRSKVIFSQQTRNSNIATNHIKSVKAKISKQNGLEDMYAERSAIFLRDHKNIVFGFSSPFLNDHSEEKAKLGTHWMLNQAATVNPLDLVRAPLLSVKAMRVVRLYSKIPTEGVLCPATYAGLLLAFSQSDIATHINIYSRTDDADIGEKVNRGTLAAFALNPRFSRSCLNIIMSDRIQRLELSEVTSASARNKSNLAYEGFKSMLQKTELAQYYNI